VTVILTVGRLVLRHGGLARSVVAVSRALADPGIDVEVGSGRHPNRAIYDPDGLRRRVVERFGPESFRPRLEEILGSRGFRGGT